MILGKTIHVIDSHTAGMPTRIITHGVPELQGSTMIDKAEYFKDNFDHIRRAVFQEPRGLMRGTGALITPPTHKDAHLGVFFLDSTYQWFAMCGHGSIGVITAAIEFGMVDIVEPATTVVLDTPAGIVTGYAVIKNGAVASVSIKNVPSFLLTSTTIHISDLGAISADIAFGGSFFVIVDAEDVHVPIQAKNAHQLSRIGLSIRDAANAQLKVTHPEHPISTIAAVRICDTSQKNRQHFKNVVVFAPGDAGIDRSPCGTGVSAYLAALYAKGEISVDAVTTHESIIGTSFTAKVESLTEMGDFPAIIPEITATAHTMGMTSLVMAPNDPVKHGFLIE